jgi:hypothetical protein
MNTIEVNDSKVFFVTFGSGKEWKPALKRIARQAAMSKRFGKIVTFSEKDLTSLEFESKLQFFSHHKRGYGLWIWKPFLINKVFDTFPECDGVLYLDAGCELNVNSVSLHKLEIYLEASKEYGGVGFSLPFLEKNWTSPMVLEAMDASYLGETKQIAGGIFFLSNNLRNRSFLNDWLNWMIRDKQKYLIGEVNSNENLVGFKEHRFDQSIFSVLWKKNEMHVLEDESFWAPDWANKGKNFPIWSTRSKLYFSFKTKEPIFFCYRAVRFLLRITSFGKINI